jgi:hypothetical protein
MLEFLDEDDGDWYITLEVIRQRIRENMLWGERDVISRLKVTIGLPLLPYMIGRGRWFEKEVSDFIYGERENPFQRSLLIFRLGLVSRSIHLIRLFNVQM